MEEEPRGLGSGGLDGRVTRSWRGQSKKGARPGCDLCVVSLLQLTSF